MDDVLFELLRFYNSHSLVSAESISQIHNWDIRIIAEYILELMDAGYLHCCDEEFHFSSSLRITAKGQAALYTEIKSRKRFKFTELRAWFTLAISVISLVLSIINTIKIFV